LENGGLLSILGSRFFAEAKNSDGTSMILNGVTRYGAQKFCHPVDHAVSGLSK
jgi:hypothetical protein